VKLKKIAGTIGYICFLTGAVVYLLIITNYLVKAGYFVQNQFDIDERAHLPLFDEAGDLTEFWKEHEKSWNMRFEPYVHWKREPFEGTYLNVDENGHRVTVKPVLSDSAKKVFVFGGSTVWGTGVMDIHTIPSILQEELGPDFDVYNYGEMGWVAAQEFNMLLSLLSKGEIPDIVIFYDGGNDSFASVYSPAIPRDPQNVRNHEEALKTSYLYRMIQGSTLRKTLRRLTRNVNWDEVVRDSIDVNSMELINLYNHHIKQVQAIAEAYDFEVYFFWQPILLSQSRQMEEYELEFINKTSEVRLDAEALIYEKAKEAFSSREEEGVFFIGDIFNEVEGPIYMDWIHVGEKGNRIIADEFIHRIPSLGDQ